MHYQHRTMPFVRPPELDGARRRVPVLIVGAGPIGLAAAIDLARHGVASVLVDESDVVSVGSRAICWSKRTLEILDRLGVGRRMAEKGVTWKVGRLFHREREVYSFDLLPETGHQFPAFVNLQQYYVEEFLIDRCRELSDRIELRFKSRLAEVSQGSDGVQATIDTPAGRYAIEADYLIAADGARSTVRDLLGLTLIGQGFEERFLITDIRMQAAFPSERWFWFEPPFHNGQSALLHKQPDDIWRIDLQLGPDADPDFERRPENVAPRIRAMIGDRPFEIDWISVYTFQCRRLARFVHGRVVFAGDSAHVVSPFGARGGNGGIQDVDNLCWKLAAVIGGAASPNLLATYDEERAHAADENLLNSSRATSFMTPKSDIERTFRDQVLALAAEHPFARRLVNSGRLSVPCSLAGLSLQSGDDPHLPGGLAPGSPAADAPVLLADGHPSWLLSHLGGRFVVLAGTPVDVPDGVDLVVVGGPIGAGSTCLGDPEGLVRQRYDLESGTAYLIRPDQHVAARFRPATRAAIADALARARGGAARP